MAAATNPATRARRSCDLGGCARRNHRLTRRKSLLTVAAQFVATAWPVAGCRRWLQRSRELSSSSRAPLAPVLVPLRVQHARDVIEHQERYLRREARGRGGAAPVPRNSVRDHHSGVRRQDRQSVVHRVPASAGDALTVSSGMSAPRVKLSRSEPDSSALSTLT